MVVKAVVPVGETNFDCGLATGAPGAETDGVIVVEDFWPTESVTE